MPSPTDRPARLQASGRPVCLGAAQGSSLAPQRLQLFRGAKFDLQAVSEAINGRSAIRIDHNSGWENPFLDQFATPSVAVEIFRRWLLGKMPGEELAGYCGHGRFSNGAWLIDRRHKMLAAAIAIRGKNVACWCSPRDACHGDVLLEIANAADNVRR